MAGSGDPKFTYINCMAPGIKAVNLQFIVLEIGAPIRTKDGSDVRTVKVADQSGSIDISVWNELGEALRPGDICRLKNGFTNVRKGCLNITCGRMGELMKIGEFTLAYSELPNMSAFNQELLSFGKPSHEDEEGSTPGGGGPGERFSRGPPPSKGNGFKPQNNPRSDRIPPKDEESPITGEKQEPQTSEVRNEEVKLPTKENNSGTTEVICTASSSEAAPVHCKVQGAGKQRNIETIKRHKGNRKRVGNPYGGFSAGPTGPPVIGASTLPNPLLFPSLMSIPPPSFNVGPFTFPPPLGTNFPTPPPLGSNFSSPPPMKRGWVKLTS